MSACGNMIIEGEVEIAPQFKRMKLQGDANTGYDIHRASLIGNNLEKELKTVFPYLSEEKIKEIVEKSENNTEAAKKMIHDLNSQETSGNRNFVNLHQQNKKRKFNEMIGLGVGTGVRTESNNNSGMTSNNLGSNTSNNLNSLPERKKFILRPASNTLIQNQNKTQVSDEEVEKILTHMEKIKSRDEAKELLKSLLPELLQKNKSESTASNTNPQQIEDLKKMNQTLISDNSELKKCVVTLYKKTEADKKVKEEHQKLKQQVERLEDELLREKYKNQYMEMLLRQLDNSNRNDFPDTPHIS